MRGKVIAARQFQPQKVDLLRAVDKAISRVKSMLEGAKVLCL